MPRCLLLLVITNLKTNSVTRYHWDGWTPSSLDKDMEQMTPHSTDGVIKTVHTTVYTMIWNKLVCSDYLQGAGYRMERAWRTLKGFFIWEVVTSAKTTPPHQVVQMLEIRALSLLHVSHTSIKKNLSFQHSSKSGKLFQFRHAFQDLPGRLIIQGFKEQERALSFPLGSASSYF